MDFNFWKCSLQLFILCYVSLNLVAKTDGLFRMTNIHCESFNKSWAVVNKCRIRAIKRGITNCNINVSFLHPAYAIDVNGVIVKKANGYKPFLVNKTIDACEFYKKRNHPVANLVLKLFQDFSTVNHTCPYMGDQVLKDFYLRENLMPLPWPKGDYGLLLTWYFHKLKIFVTNVYFEIDNGS